MTAPAAGHRAVGARSAELMRRARAVMPGGVSSPVRAFRGVGGDPLFFKRAEGAWLFDEDDNGYIDYIGAWGPLIGRSSRRR